MPPRNADDEGRVMICDCDLFFFFFFSLLSLFLRFSFAILLSRDSRADGCFWLRGFLFVFLHILFGLFHFNPFILMPNFAPFKRTNPHRRSIPRVSAVVFFFSFLEIRERKDRPRAAEIAWNFCDFRAVS